MSYNESRNTFIGELSSQVSPMTGEEMFDPKGQISRMVARGESKERIIEELEKLTIFNTYVEKMNSSEEDNLFEKYVIDNFRNFYESLQNLKNPKNPFNFREELAALIIKNYPEAEEFKNMILEKSSSTKIFNALDNIEPWQKDAKDYLTRGDVDIPSGRQNLKWARFSELVDFINDADLYL